MKFLLVFHFIATVLLATGVYLKSGGNSAFSFFLGSGVIFFNFLALIYAWPRILGKKTNKKMIALPIGVIVIKFAILGYIAREVVTSEAVNVWWFMAGVAVVLLSTTATGLFAADLVVNMSPHASEKVDY